MSVIVLSPGDVSVNYRGRIHSAALRYRGGSSDFWEKNLPQKEMISVLRKVRLLHSRFQAQTAILSCPVAEEFATTLYLVINGGILN